MTEFTDAQRAAIEHEGALCVTAGAGSGKTLVLAQRVAWLISTGRCDPLQLLAVTFSVKAARELRDRLSRLIDPDEAARMTVVTLHALGLRMVRAHGDLLGYRLDERQRRPAVVAGGERDDLLREALKAAERALADQDAEASRLVARLSVAEAGDAISRAKAAGRESIAGDSGAARALAAAMAAYQRLLKERNVVDFDDMILQPQLLLRDPQALRFYQDRWTHVLVDEFQDTSAAQYDIIRQIAAGHGNLTVIGDPCQSIYRFRGAMGAEGFNRFLADFPAAKTVYLPDNFRSAREIVRVGDALMDGLKPPQRAARSGGVVALARAGSEHDEAAAIAAEIERAVATGYARHSEIAVLCRTNAQFAPIERALMRAGLPYRIVGQGTFFERREIRDILSYVTLSQDWMGDPLALRRIVNVPARGLGPAALNALRGDDPELTIEHLLDGERVAALPAAAQAGVRRLLDDLRTLADVGDRPPAEIIERVMAPRAEGGLGYRDHLLAAPGDGGGPDEKAAQRVERVRALWRIARRYKAAPEFLDDIDVMSGQDPLSMASQERVQVMTLHDAKGLEFPVVFLAGCEESLLPHWFSQDSQTGLDEERRLCYVGFTRAQRALVISYARARGGKPTAPSRFLRGLPADGIRRGLPDWAALARPAA